jgi:hypothetical protein
VAVTPEGTAKASEVIEALLGARELPIRIVRTALLGPGGTSPFDLDALRAQRRAAKAAQAQAEAVATEG